MFHPFKRLPFELRIAIWALSLESRVITQSEKAIDMPKQKFRRVPAILHVCHESRKEFLDVDGSGAKRVHPTYRYVEILYPVYIAVKLDVIYMLSKFYPVMLPVGKITDHELLLPNLAPEIQHLAIEFSGQELEFRACYYSRDGARLPFFDNSISNFPSLKTITISINYRWWYSAYSGNQPGTQLHARENEKTRYREKYPGRLGGFVNWVRAAEREMKDRLPQFEGLEVKVPTMKEFRAQAGLDFWTANVHDTGKWKNWKDSKEIEGDALSDERKDEFHEYFEDSYEDESHWTWENGVIVHKDTHLVKPNEDKDEEFFYDLQMNEMMQQVSRLRHDGDDSVALGYRTNLGVFFERG